MRDSPSIVPDGLGRDVQTRARMTKYLDASPPRQSARANRERLVPKERPAIMEEIAQKAADVRTNMARLGELRLAKEAQEVQTDNSAILWQLHTACGY